MSTEAISVPANDTALDQAIEFAESFAKTHQLSEDVTFALKLALEELVVNVVMHGIAPANETKTVSVELDIKNGKSLEIVFKDNTCEFDPLSLDEPNTALGVEEREVGGLGIFLIRKLMTDVSYAHEEGVNTVTMTMNLER